MEKDLKNIEKLRIQNQVFQTRKDKLLAERRQEAFAMFRPGSEELVEDKDGVLEITRSCWGGLNTQRSLRKSWK